MVCQYGMGTPPHTNGAPLGAIYSNTQEVLVCSEVDHRIDRISPKVHNWTPSRMGVVQWGCPHFAGTPPSPAGAPSDARAHRALEQVFQELKEEKR